MFVNGDAALVVVKLLVVGLLLVCLALLSHVVWVCRLARSRALGTLGPAARITLLTLAAATPVVSFYGVGIALVLQRLAQRRGQAGAARVVLGILGALAVVMLGFLAIAALRQPMPGAHRPDMLSRLPGIILVSAVPCVVLAMACQVLARSNLARVGWVIVAGAAAICLFLLV